MLNGRLTALGMSGAAIVSVLMFISEQGFHTMNQKRIDLCMSRHRGKVTHASLKL